MIYIIFVSSLISSLLIYVWHRSVDLTPFPWDQISHLIFTLKYHNFLITHDFANYFSYFDWYTPLVYWIGSVFVYLVPHTLLPLAINTFFLVIYLLFLFLSYPRKYKKYALLIALLFLNTLTQSNPVPGYVISIKEFLLDIPLALMVCNLYTLYLIIKRENKVNFGFILLISISLTATVLTKNPGFIYTLPFVVIYLIQISVLNINKSKKIICISLLLLLLIIENWWFALNFNEIQKVSNFHLKNGILEKDPQGILGVLTNIYWVISYSYSTLLLLFVGLIVFYKQIFLDIKKNANILITPFYIFLMILIFSIIPNKELRYILPIIWLFYYSLSRYLAEKLSINYLYPSIIILSLLLPLRIWFSLPKPLLNKTAYHYVKDFLISYKPSNVNYFYETDSPLFNYDSAIYLSTQNSVNFSHLNSNYDKSNLAFPKNCEIKRGKSYIIVYSTADDSNQQGDENISFEQFCSSTVLKRCSLFKQKNLVATNEKIRIFECN